MGWFFNSSDDDSGARSKELQDIHNKGEQDAGNNISDRPHDIIDVLTSSGETAEKMIEDIEAYKAGWDNGWKQR